MEAGPLELSWSEVPGAIGYRVLVRDAASGEYRVKEQVDRPVYTVPEGLLEAGRRYEWRPQARTGRLSRWTDVLPALHLPVPPAKGAVTTPLEWRDRGAAAYRVVIRDETAGEIVVKDGVQEPRYVVDWSRLDAAHHLRYRVQDFRDGAWANEDRYRPLNPPAGLIPSRLATRPGASGGEILFLFTVDTEANLRYMPDPLPERAVEHQILGMHDGREYGIGLMMDMLDRHGFKATFFVDILAEYSFGEGSLTRAVETIRARGHDVQLHLHSAPHLRWADDEAVRRLSYAIRHDDEELFRGALDLAVRLFEQRTGERPVAYRSGGYNLSDCFFPVLEEHGIRVDSSLYPFKNCRVSDWMRTRTQPFWVDRILEVPVSWSVDYRESGQLPRQFAPFRHDGGQQAAFTALAPAGGSMTLVYLAHSYSLLRRVRPEDPVKARAEWDAAVRRRYPGERYQILDLVQTEEPSFYDGPDEDRIANLARALEQLAARGDVRGITMSELAERHLDCWERPSSPVEPVPVWRSGRPHVTGTRRYSSEYLAELERRARVRA
jgi:peptidoglycan/xylan/chitin deacetylase (PgdA/CDA1 family)